MNYKVDQIITNEDRHNLIDLYNSMPTNFGHTDYNLYNIDKRILKRLYDLDPKYKTVFEKVENYAGYKTYSHYFVMYNEGSYTRMHTDNDDHVKSTIVTLVDTVNLVGGETIVTLPAPEAQYEKKGYVKGNEHKGRVVPKIVRMNVGDSVIYDRSLLHGVTQVEQGKRLVLVSWFRDERL